MSKLFLSLIGAFLGFSIFPKMASLKDFYNKGQHAFWRHGTETVKPKIETTKTPTPNSIYNKLALVGFKEDVSICWISASSASMHSITLQPVYCTNIAPNFKLLNFKLTYKKYERNFLTSSSFLSNWTREKIHLDFTYLAKVLKFNVRTRLILDKWDCYKFIFSKSIILLDA